MQYIYTRVSTDKQETVNQVHSLKEKYPKAIIVEETGSGTKDRPQLNALLESLKPGDYLIIAALDRLGRRTADLITLLDSLEKRGINLVSERESIDYSTSPGKMIARIFCVLAENERDIIADRTRTALARIKAEGRKLGPPRRILDDQVNTITELKKAGLSVRAIASKVGFSFSRVAQIIREQSKGASHA